MIMPIDVFRYQPESNKIRLFIEEIRINLRVRVYRFKQSFLLFGAKTTLFSVDCEIDILFPRLRSCKPNGFCVKKLPT